MRLKFKACKWSGSRAVLSGHDYDSEEGSTNMKRAMSGRVLSIDTDVYPMLR